jgi:hypothetical protein
MCDYSMEHVRSRSARLGDRLVTQGFLGTLTHGFAAEEDRSTAICLLPGTELAFDQNVKVKGIFFYKSLGVSTAIFRQVDVDNPYRFHDALEFADGTIVLLTMLKNGQRASVLQLPATGREKTENRSRSTRHDANLRPLPSEGSVL